MDSTDKVSDLEECGGSTRNSTPYNPVDGGWRSTEESHLDENNWDRKVTYPASGLTNSLHGAIYQLKHLMLILHLAWVTGYRFRLATEMDSAEKFDDLVFEFEENSGSRKHLFMQLKHKQDDIKLIGVDELLADNDGDFSVIKYFRSWRRIKKHSDFAGSGSKRFILCTNANLDLDQLKDENIDVEEVDESERFPNITHDETQSRCYKLTPNPRSKMYDELKSASDVHELAKVLAKCVHGSKALSLRTDLLKRYHVALAQEIVDIEGSRFSDNFICNRDLSPNAAKFRQIFFEYSKRFAVNKNSSEPDIWNRLGRYKFDVSKGFGVSSSKLQYAQLVELPDDNIVDEEISEFLQELFLAVNQPNEVQLDAMIERALGECSDLRLLNLTFIRGSFQDVTLDWFKRKGGEYLNREDAEKFFDDLERELISLITVGLNLPYPQKLKEYNIEWECENEEVRSFLESSNSTDNQIMLQITSSEQSLLTALRIYQTIESMEQYTKKDSFIFIELENLLLPVIMSQVFRAFQSRKSHNLLIIDCGLNSADQNTDELWEEICRIMKGLGTKKITGKRIIVIIPQKDARIINLRSLVCSICNETEDQISLDKLKKNTQRNLLKRKVIRFQGRGEKTSYGFLLGTENLNNVKVGKMADYRRIMNPETLVRIIQGTEIRIGGKLEGLGEMADYYMPRTIDRHVVIKNDIFKDTQGIDDIFAISGIDETTLEKLWKHENGEEESSSQQRKHRDPNKYLILQTGQEKHEFDMHCRDKTDYNIHWLQGESGKLVWKESHGSVVNLVKYRQETRRDDDADKHGVIPLTEQELVECRDDRRKIVILSDTAGMGKSTLLTRLAEIIKENEPSLLVIKINLTDHTKVLDSEQKNRRFHSDDYDGAVDFLVEKLIPNLEPEAVLVFRMMIKVRRAAAFFFDGFDEISPDYKVMVADLIEALSKNNPKKLFVTTRPHTSRTLEEKLGVFSHSLQPFSVANQVEFLIKFWESEIGSSQNKVHMERRAKQLITLLTNAINRSMQEFTGVPLQTRMVAEIFPYAERIKFTEELPKSMTILELYRRFVDTKYEIYKKVKSNDDFTKPANKDNDQGYRQSFSNEHRKFSLHALFDNKTVGLFIHEPKVNVLCESALDRTEEEAMLRKGMIIQFVDGSPQFIHRTFAEYFAATLLFEKLIDDSRNQPIREFSLTQLFVGPEYKVIRAFLNCLFTDKGHVGQKNSWSFILKRHCDPQGETAYHVAARERHAGIVKFLLNRLTEDHRLEFSNINCVSKDDYTPLANAMRTTHNAEVVKCFVDAGADINCRNLGGSRSPLEESICAGANYDVIEYVIKNSGNIESVTMDNALCVAAKLGKLDAVKCLEMNGANIHCLNFRPLRNAAVSGNLELVEYLLQRSEGINSPSRCYDSTPLYSATPFGRIEVVKYSTENGPNIDSTSERGETPLHLGAAAGHLNVVKHLTNEGANINAETNEGVTPLHSAARSGEFEVLKYFIERVENIHSLTRSGDTILHYAAASGNLVVVRHLIERGLSIHCANYYNETPLHSAAEFSNMSVIQYLLDEGADINSRTYDGETLLHYASKSWYDGDSELGLVQFLLEKGIDINSRTATGATALRMAVEKGKTHVVEHLLDHGANLHYLDYSGRTVMHDAAGHNQIEVVKLLAGKGVSMHFPDYFGQTPLHLAALCGNLDLVEYLINEGADIRFKTKRGETPLYFAVRSGDFNLVEYLMKQGADIYVKTKDHETLLQAAVRYGFLDIVEYLMENGVTGDGKALLYYATASRNLDLVKFFVKKGVDVNFKTGQGETPLHQAARRGTLNVVKYLTENGVIIDSLTYDGQTSLHYAARFGNLDVIKYLAKKGADICSPTEDGTTPLHLAAAFRRTDIVKHLAAEGADIHSPDRYGQTPLHLAAMCNALEVAKFLVDGGADLHYENKEGRTPLQVAAKHRAITVHDYLMKKVEENPPTTVEHTKTL